MAKCPKCKSTDISIFQYKWYTHYYNAPTGTDKPCESSRIYCLACQYSWRTTAKYVEDLKAKGKISENEKRNILIMEENRKKLQAGISV